MNPLPYKRRAPAHQLPSYHSICHLHYLRHYTLFSFFFFIGEEHESNNTFLFLFLFHFYLLSANFYLSPDSTLHLVGLENPGDLSFPTTRFHRRLDLLIEKQKKRNAWLRLYDFHQVKNGLEVKIHSLSNHTHLKGLGSAGRYSRFLSNTPRSVLLTHFHLIRPTYFTPPHFIILLP